MSLEALGLPRFGETSAHNYAGHSVTASPQRGAHDGRPFADQVRSAIDGAHSTSQLDTFARSLWGGLAAGMLDEAEATGLSERLEAKRLVLCGHRGRAGDGAALAVVEPRRQTLFARAKAQRPPDRQRSIERRRRLAASGPMPPALACAFTTAELAVLRIIADEVRANGACTRTIGELAARAGTCESLVKRAVRYAVAKRLLHKQERPRPGRKHLANVLTIISREWRVWIDRRPPSRWAAATGGKLKTATDTRFKKEANRDERGAGGSVPPRPAGRPFERLSGRKRPT